MDSLSRISNQLFSMKIADPPTLSQVYLRDRSHLLSVFPEEVWLIILDKVNETDSLEMLTNSSTFIREVLLPKRTNFLFHSVWKVLVNGDYYNCIAESHTESALNGRPLDELLKLRLVCHCWNKAIDSFYQHHADHFRVDQHWPCFRENVVVAMSRTRVKMSHGANQPIALACLRRHSSYPIMDSLDLFHCLFDSSYLDTGRNPFFGRSISFHISSNDIIDHSERSQKILNTYGKHIWYCQLYILDAFSTAAECFSKIRAVLLQLPNLKMLHIGLDKHRNVWKPKDLVPEIKQWSLPTFERLQMLSIDSTLPPILQELLRRNSHISTLAVHHNNVQGDNNDIFSVALQNLKILSIRFNTMGCFLETINSDADWSGVTELHLHLNWTATTFRWQDVLDALRNKFKSCLMTLNLTLPRCVDKSTAQLLSAKYQLYLPKVSHLKLSISCLARLDFLLPMGDSLQVLQIAVNPGRNENVDEVIKKVKSGNGSVDELFRFYDCKKGEFDTNIWSYFPKLKNVHVDFYSNKPASFPTETVFKYHWYCSRKEWEGKVKASENNI